MTIYTVIFSADNGLRVEVLAGNNAPQITDGYANWEVVDRPKRPGITRYTGRNPVTQDISVRFDGNATNTPQDQQINTLMRMAQPGTDLSEPPKIKLGGIAKRKDLTWIITGIDEDASSAMWITLGGVPVIVRQDMTVHLTQYIDDSVLTTAASPAVAAQTKKKKVQIRTPDGMTLKTLAKLEYPNDPSNGMVLILEANQFLDPDPRKIIPTGTPITIPDLSNGTTSTFIVP